MLAGSNIATFSRRVDRALANAVLRPDRSRLGATAIFPLRKDLPGSVPGYRWHGRDRALPYVAISAAKASQRLGMVLLADKGLAGGRGPC